MKLIPPGGRVIFDGDCGICTQTIRLLQTLDWGHRLKFHSNNDPKTFETFPDISLERSRQEILVHDLRTGWYGGYEACVWIGCRIPALWILIPITFIPGVDYMGHRIYKWVARNRHIISAKLGLNACKIS
jgi:predicted DCC family thiol-disulfide oxidoreductase YuxK